MAKNFIQGAIKHPGALTRYAKSHNTTVKALESSTPAKAVARVKREINLAKTLASLPKHHNHK